MRALVFAAPFCHCTTVEMSFARFLLKSLLTVSYSLSVLALDVPVPQTAVTTGNVVYGNFLGISFELSYLGDYSKSPSFPRSSKHSKTLMSSGSWHQ